MEVVELVGGDVGAEGDVLEVGDFEEGAALGGEFAGVGVLGEDGSGDGSGDEAFGDEVVDLLDLDLEGLDFGGEGLVGLAEGMGLGLELFLEDSDGGLEVIDLFLWGGVGLEEGLEAVGFGLLLFELLPEGVGEEGDVLEAGLGGLDGGLELGFFEVELGGVDGAEVLAFFEGLPFGYKELGDGSGGLCGDGDFGGFKCAGGLILAVLRVAGEEEEGEEEGGDVFCFHALIVCCAFEGVNGGEEGDLVEVFCLFGEVFVGEFAEEVGDGGGTGGEAGLCGGSDVLAEGDDLVVVEEEASEAVDFLVFAGDGEAGVVEEEVALGVGGVFADFDFMEVVFLGVVCAGVPCEADAAEVEEVEIVGEHVEAGPSVASLQEEAEFGEERGAEEGFLGVEEGVLGLEELEFGAVDGDIGQGRRNFGGGWEAVGVGVEGFAEHDG